MRVLLLEDDLVLSDLLVQYYSDDFICDAVATLEDAKNHIDAYNYNVVLLDRTLEGEDSGLTLIKHIKERDPKTGIIVISAYGSSNDKIDGLNMGADDYLDKPFDNDELKARIYALSRRHTPSVIELDRYIFDLDKKTIMYNTSEIVLSHKENDLLFFLLCQEENIVTKDAILNALYHNPENIVSNTIDVMIANIRKKLPLNIIQTIKTRGYRIGLKD